MLDNDIRVYRIYQYRIENMLDFSSKQDALREAWISIGLWKAWNSREYTIAERETKAANNCKSIVFG